LPGAHGGGRRAGAIFFNHGQVCTAGSRLLVHRSIYEAVTAGLAEAANGMVLGSGFDPAAQMGPLVSARQRERVDSFAGRHRAGRKAGGGRPCARGEGFFYRPTVFVDGTPDMTICREECSARC
jgi:phenylacetaldehyde dehydrogenase